MSKEKKPITTEMKKDVNGDITSIMICDNESKDVRAIQLFRGETYGYGMRERYQDQGLRKINGIYAIDCIKHQDNVYFYDESEDCYKDQFARILPAIRLLDEEINEIDIAKNRQYVRK